MMKIYQVIQSSGDWEDRHEFVVYTTTDREKAEYIISTDFKQMRKC